MLIFLHSSMRSLQKKVFNIFCEHWKPITLMILQSSLRSRKVVKFFYEVKGKVFSVDFSWPFYVLKFLAQYWIMGGNFCFANAYLLWSWCFQLSIIHESIERKLSMTFCQKTLQPQGPERKIFSIYTNRRKKKLEQQLKNDHQFCNNDHDQEMQSYAKGHGNSSALCSTGTTDLQDGVALSPNTSLNLSINRLQVFRSLYFIDQWQLHSGWKHLKMSYYFTTLQMFAFKAIFSV